MRNQTTLSQITLAVAIIASAVIWSERPANRVFAIQDSEDRPSPLAIAFGQSLFLNVANVGSEDPIPIEMVIFDADGNPLKRARHLLRPGHTESLSINRTDISGRGHGF